MMKTRSTSSPTSVREKTLSPNELPNETVRFFQPVQEGKKRKTVHFSEMCQLILMFTITDLKAAKIPLDSLWWTKNDYKFFKEAYKREKQLNQVEEPEAGKVYETAMAKQAQTTSHEKDQDKTLNSEASQYKSPSTCLIMKF